MRKFVDWKRVSNTEKGAERQAPEWTPGNGKEKEKPLSGLISLSGFPHCENQPDEFLGCVGNGDVIMLALGAFLGKVSGKSRVPMADVFGGVKEGIAEIAGASLFHVRISVGQFAGLVDGRTQTRVSEDFVRGIETGEVANFGEDDGSHAIIDSGYRKNWRIPFVHDGFYLCFNFVNFVGEFLNEFESMLQLRRLGGHDGADGTLRRVADFHGFFAVIAASGGVMREIGQAGKMRSGNLRGSRKLAQKSGNGGDMRTGNRFFQFGDRILTGRETDCFSFARS